MGEISNIIDLYIPTAPEYIDKIKEISLYSKEQSVLTLNQGMNSYPKKRYWKITGNTMRSIKTDFIVDNAFGVVRGYVDEGTSPYGPYVDRGHHSWGGYQFLKGGLEATLKRYGD